MNDKEYKRITKIIDRLCKVWLSTLGFSRWAVKVSYFRESKEDQPECAASCHTMWEYQDMLIKVYIPVMEDWEEKKIEEIFVHECLHGLVNEMREWTPDRMCHEEHVVTQLTQAILWAKHDGKQLGRKERGKK